MRKLFVVAAAAAALMLAPSAAPAHVAPYAALKPCSAGWTHAALSWGHKCLRRGQFCKTYEDRQYHRYGFHCHSGRLH